MQARIAKPILIAAAAVALFHCLSYIHVTFDDAFISLRYAANLAAGHGLRYNLATPPVEGFSNPLFTFLCALGIALGFDPLNTVKFLGVISFILCLALLPPFCRSLRLRHPASIAAAAALILAASPFVALSAVSGLETLPHTVLFLAAATLALKESSSGHVRFSPACFALLAMSRPEGALPALVTALWQATAAQRPIAALKAWAAGFVAPCAAALTLRYFYYGAWLPNTYAAKVSFGAPSALAGAHYAWGFVRDGGFLLLLPLLAAALLRLWRHPSTQEAAQAKAAEKSSAPSTGGAGRPGYEAAFADSPFLGPSNGKAAQQLPLWTLAVLLCAAQIFFAIAVAGDFMLGYRFIVPIYPFLCVAAVASLAATAGQLSRSRVNTTVRGQMGSLALGATLLAGGLFLVQRQALAGEALSFWLSRQWPASRYAGQTDLRGTWLEAHQLSGEYVRLHARKGDLLAVSEAGVIPYYARLDTLDILGLNDSYIAGLGRRSALERKQRPNGELIREYILSKSPRWIVLDGVINPGSGGFRPRLDIAWWLLRDPRWLSYRPVFQAPLCRADEASCKQDMVDVVFQRIE